MEFANLLVKVPHVHLHIIPRYKGDWMNNDDIYPALQTKEFELNQELCETAYSRRKGPDSDRPPRTAEDMSIEASSLRTLFKQYEDIWVPQASV